MTDCEDDDYRINPTTVWYNDEDQDGFADATIDNRTQCADPGANYYLPTELITHTHADTDLGSGLVGYWSFDYGDARDESSNSNTGTLVGDTSSTGGQIGNAMSFDGNGDYVDIPYDINLRPDNFTISLWVK